MKKTLLSVAVAGVLGLGFTGCAGGSSGPINLTPLAKEEITLNNLYLKEFIVNKYDYVNVGTKIATAYDISKAKLIIYLNSEDYKDIKSKQIYLDGKKSDVKIKKFNEEWEDEQNEMS